MRGFKDLEGKIKAQGESKGYHIFSNKNRREIFRELTRLPCRTATSISTATGIDVKAVLWHLEKLRREKFVDFVKIDRRYYIVPDLILLEDIPLFAILSRREAKRILRTVWNGCVAISELNISKSTLYRLINILSDLGVVERSGERKRYLCGTEKLRELAEKYDKIGRDFKKEFIKRIETRSFDVEIVGVVNYELRIRITGMENFSMGVFISPVRTALGVL